MRSSPARPHAGHVEAQRLPPLDGVRGLAVLAVMISHFYGLNRLKDLLWTDRIYATLTDGGWIGVDLFFVLSGFLITGILYDSKGGEGYFRSFYMRRVLRIFPLYYGFLFVVFVVAPLLVQPRPNDLQWLIDHQWWYWLYIPNFLGATFTNHVPPYTGHLWSLAIEEQFYICWPLVVFLCSRRTLLRVCAGVIALSLLLRIGFRLTDVPRDWVYIVTPARLDGLASGAMVTLLIRSPSGRALVARHPGRRHPRRRARARRRGRHRHERASLRRRGGARGAPRPSSPARARSVLRSPPHRRPPGHDGRPGSTTRSLLAATRTTPASPCRGRRVTRAALTTTSLAGSGGYASGTELAN